MIQAARQYRDTRSSNRPGLVLLRCLMGPGDKDREGRTHLRTRRIGRSRSAACRAGHGVDGGWLVLGPPQPSSGSRTIVAGYDGTAVGREAVVQAGLQAGPTGCVFVVYAYGSPGSRFGRVRRLKAAWAAGRRALEDLFNDGDPLPDADYVEELIPGWLHDAIRHVAYIRRADAIVVGARQTGPMRTVLSSFSRGRLLAAGVPVVIVSELQLTPTDVNRSVSGTEMVLPGVETC